MTIVLVCREVYVCVKFPISEFRTVFCLDGSYISRQTSNSRNSELAMSILPFVQETGHYPGLLRGHPEIPRQCPRDICRLQSKLLETAPLVVVLLGLGRPFSVCRAKRTE
jgi:hypothetical protein